MLKLILTAVAVFCATGAQASSISSLIISDLSFDVQTETPSTSDVNVAAYTGVSGLTASDSIGWTVAAAFDPLSDTTSTQSFSGFGSVGAQSYEHLHVHSFSISFDEAIDSLLFVVENDNNFMDVLLDLGIDARDAQGIVLPKNTGYRIITGNQATWVLYEFDTAVTEVTNLPGSGIDGYDMAFFAGVSDVAPIPLPASIPLLGAGLGALVMVSRRRRRG